MFSCVVGREEHCKQISLVSVGSAHSVLSTLGLPQLMAACAFPVYTAQAPGCSGGVLSNCPKHDLHLVHFPGLSCSSSGSWLFHKSTDSVGLAFCALPRSKQLRQLRACRVHCPRCALPLNSLPSPVARFPRCTVRAPSLVCLLWGGDLRL